MKQKYYRKWLFMAPLGLVLIGMGICFIIESAFLKFGSAPTWEWVLSGTGSLVVFNSGLCLFRDAIIARIQYLNMKT